MSVLAKPTTEQPTQPLPVIDLPRGTGLSNERGVWLAPATVLAAVAVGASIRAWLDTDGRFTLAVLALVVLLALAGGALLTARVIDR